VALRSFSPSPSWTPTARPNRPARSPAASIALVSRLAQTAARFLSAGASANARMRRIPASDRRQRGTGTPGSTTTSGWLTKSTVPMGAI
jgi:hypothetical protein